MRETYRVLAERDDDGSVRVILFETDVETEVMSILDMVAADDLRTAFEHLVETHDLENHTLHVREDNGHWSEPDCITVLEALECTLGPTPYKPERKTITLSIMPTINTRRRADLHFTKDVDHELLDFELGQAMGNCLRHLADAGFPQSDNMISLEVRFV